MRAFITGIGGFAGGYLACSLAEQGHQVSGTDHGGGPNQKLVSLIRKFPGQLSLDKVFGVDVRQYQKLREGLQTAMPDVVFHLAATTFAPEVVHNPGEAFSTNVVGTINLLRAARAVNPGCRVMVISSGDAYGASSVSDSPMYEDMALKPVTLYGISKAAAEMVAQQAHWNYGQEIILIRPFNHTGPGQSNRFVCSAFASQLAEIEAGRRKPIVSTGNLAPWRDFSDVRDIVDGYIQLAEAGKTPEVYNLCSGKAVRVGEVLRELIEMSGLEVEVRESADKVRQREISFLVGSYEKSFKTCGWEPAVELKRTLREVLDYWRWEVRQQDVSGDRNLP